VSTYIIAVLVLLAGGLCSVASDIVRLTTTSQFHDAARVTPWIALGVMCQGLYLVGSNGLVITKRTTRYPVATGIAAGASLLANWLLIPRFGVLGAAWANTIAYATLAVVTVGFSLHLYPIPYEWSRLFRVSVAGIAAYVASDLVVPHTRLAALSLILHGTVMVLTYVASLFVTGFFHAGEIGALRALWQRTLQRRALRARPPDPTQVEMAGEIVATPSEPDSDGLDAAASSAAGTAVSGRFQDPDR
jgi:O-antigen/teichoic acid export membrane protein